MPARIYRSGQSIEDYCRACKTDRLHTVMAADSEGRPIRVVCDYCRSEHNYRGGPRIEVSREPAADAPPPAAWERPRTPAVREPARSQAAREAFPVVSDRERIAPPVSINSTTDLELLLRRIIRE